jgi:SAM-dependent methyltransferase
MDCDAYERRLWEGRAAAYERGFARLTAYTAGALLDAAGVAAGTSLLDVGTGPGVVARAAVARGAQVTAVDAEPSMAEAAARNVPGLDVRVAVLPDLPLPDGAFDAVTGNFVINAVGDRRPRLQSCAGCCAEAGGCDQPAAACEVHHVTHLADGGTTSVDGCALYCFFHHHVAIQCRCLSSAKFRELAAVEA